MYEDLQQSIRECQQSRTRYQIEKFVIGQHDTAEMQFVQVVRELEKLISALKIRKLENKKTEIKISQLIKTNDEINLIDAEILEFSLKEGELSELAATRELEILLEIYNKMTHFTREQIDASQPEYWQARLSRQANLQMLSGAPTWSHLEALDQIGFLAPLLDSANKNQKELDK